MFGKGQRVYSFVFFQFQTQFFAKAFTPYRPGPAKGAHRAKRCANNDSGALKAQGDASGRERAQTDGSLVRGGLCFFVFLEFVGNFFTNFTDSGQPKVVLLQLQIELFRWCPWQHVFRGDCIFYQLISSSICKGKPLE